MKNVLNSLKIKGKTVYVFYVSEQHKFMLVSHKKNGKKRFKINLASNEK